MIPPALTNMTEPKAFMREIRRNPSDNLPRLVYADWLEEHGEAEYAEFIRFAVAKQGELSVFHHPVYSRLIEYGRRYSKGDAVGQDRGFISSVQITQPLRKYRRLYCNSCLTEITFDAGCIRFDFARVQSGTAAHWYIENLYIDGDLSTNVESEAKRQGGWTITDRRVIPLEAKNSWIKCRKLLSDACILYLKRLCDELS